MSAIATTGQAGATAKPLRARGLFTTHWTNAVWVLPFLVVFAALLLYPLVLGVLLSLSKSDMFSAPRFVGLQNYVRLFGDRIFLLSLWNTLVFVVMTVPAFVALGLALALALNREGRVAAVLRAIFFGTTVLSVTVVALMWKVILMPNGGPVGLGLASVGLSPVAFLTNPNWALGAVAAVTLWWGIGLPMVLFLSALQQIPREVYEAAALDNASRWTTLRRITLPAIRRTVVLVIIVQLVLQFQVFSQIQLLTGGGPNNATRSIVHFVYQQAFQNWDAGYAAAASQVLFVLILVPALFQYWIARRAART